MFKCIMLAVDGSRYTDSVLSLGIRMSRKFDSHIHVMTVADIRIFEWATAVGADGFVPIVPSGIYQDESRKILEEKCDKVLEKCRDIMKKENVKFETEKIFGSPVDSIIEHSNMADLVIMGKRGEFARFDRKSLGATVEAVSRNVQKPLIVTNDSSPTIENILALYDGSAHANKALQCVGHIAEAFQSSVHILCVTSDTEVGEHYVKEAEKYLGSYDLRLSGEIIPGHPDKEILNYIQKKSFDLVALGAYGHSRIREAILGSTTEHVLRFVPCPVLLAK